MYLDKEKHVFPNQALDLVQKASSEYLGHPLACPTSMARDKDNKDATDKGDATNSLGGLPNYSRLRYVAMRLWSASFSKDSIICAQKLRQSWACDCTCK